MRKKIFSIVFVLAGVLIFTGAGCGNRGLIKSSGKITTGECADLAAIAKYASYLLTARNDAGHSALWSKKLYDEMDAYGAKYGLTRDGVAQACKAKVSEPGFSEEMERRMQELGK